MTTILKRSSTLFLQAVTVLIGAAVLTFLLWEPHLEGVNANATSFREIYFDDPFLAYVYLGSIPFFLALYQVCKLLGYIGQAKVFSVDSVHAARTIKYCAMTLIGFILGAEVWIIVAMGGKDDITGGIAMGIFALIISIIVACVAAVSEKWLMTKK